MLEGNHPRAKQFDAGAAIHSPFENLQSIDLALRLPTAPGFKNRVSDSVEILTRSSREALHAVRPLECTTCASADAFRKPRPLRRASRANAVRAMPSFGTKTGALATFSVRHPYPFHSQRLCARLFASLIFMVKSKTVVDGGPLWPSHEIFDRPAGPNSLLGSDLARQRPCRIPRRRPCRIRRRFCIRRSSGIFHILFGSPGKPSRPPWRNGQYAPN